MSRIYNIKQPRQRLSWKQKTRDWRKENVDYGNTYSFYLNDEIRRSLENKIINLNLYNGKVNIEDIKSILNPNDENASYIPDNIPHHPIIVPKIDLLVGEELNRPFDFNFIVTDSNSVTKKVEDKKKVFYDNISKFLNENYTDEELDAEMKKLNDYMTYTWKDSREKMANQIMKYYFIQGSFKEKFSKGFKDALLFGEECYLIDVVNGEPVMEVLNTLKVRTAKTGLSDRFEDASVIVIEDFKSPNRLIDEYSEELKPSDIDKLLSFSSSGGNGSYSDDYNNPQLIFSEMGYDGSHFNEVELNGHYFSNNLTDEHGNIRELRVRWKSLRKVLKVKYYDEFGKVQYKFESEEYILNDHLGEESTNMWISEGWEGIMLGKDIYLKMRPLPVQYCSADKPHKNHLGVIGQLYNTNQSKPVSLVDRAKNYQYMYNVVWDRLNKAIAANHGKIMEIDIAKIPDGWEIEKWLHFAYVNKIAVLDSFKEGNKGQSTGKLAGNMNTVGGRAIDMETGQYIQQHIQLLEFIKTEMSEVLGISKQREGEIQSRETVGGVERSVNQSSHITEYWFSKHESVKLRVLSAFLEMAKHALKKEGNKQVQFILDDQTSEILNIDANEFVESDYGVVATNSNKYRQLEEMLKQNAQAMIQSGVSYKMIMDIMFSNSLMDMRRKIENAENEVNERNAQAQQQEQEANQAKLEQEAKKAQDDLEFKYYEADQVDATKRYIAELNNSKELSDSEKQSHALAVDQLEFEKNRSVEENRLKLKELHDKVEMHNKTLKNNKQ